MSALDKLMNKDFSQLTAIEKSITFVATYTYGKNAAEAASEELSAKDAEIVRLKGAIKKIANMKNYKLKNGETIHEAYYRCYATAENALQEDK